MHNTKDEKFSYKNFFANKKILFSYIILFILFLILSIAFIGQLCIQHIAKSYENSILQIANLNRETVFSLDDIFIFSSATATNHADSNALWSLDIHQYSDISLFINNHSSNGYTTKNTISKLYLNNFKIEGTTVGSPSLSYKNVQSFGKFVDLDETAISDTLTYTVTNGDTIDSTVAQMDLACKTPITLGYLNKNIKEDYAIVDTTSALQYNGSLLQKASVLLENITPVISFDIHIVNQLDEKYILRVRFAIPFEDTSSSIYDGTFQKTISYNKAFFREI